MEAALSDIVLYSGGQEKFVTDWNGYNLGRKIKLNGNSVSYMNGDDIEAEDVASFIQAQSKNNELRRDARKRLENAFIGSDGVLQPYESLQVEASLLYQDLPSFRVKGEKIGIVGLAEKNPLLAMEIARDWSAKQVGQSVNSSGLGLADNSLYVDKPSAYFRGSKNREKSD